MKALHRRTMGAATALLMAASLAACNDDAPSAAAPTSASSNSSQSGGSSDTAPSTDSPSPSDSSSEAPSPSSDTASSDSSSDSSSSGGSSGGTCSGASSQDASKAVSGTTQMGKWGQSMSRTDDSGRKITIKVDKGSTKAPSSSDFFDDGQVGGLIPITIDFDPGDAAYKKDYLSYIEFTLRDPSGNVCRWASISKLGGPNNDIMDGVYVSDQNKQAKGTLIFQVPEGADLSKYTLTWTGDSGSATAQLGWGN